MQKSGFNVSCCVFDSDKKYVQGSASLTTREAILISVVFCNMRKIKKPQQHTHCDKYRTPQVKYR